MGARRQRGSRSLIWGRWLQGHQPVQGKTALRVAMMARSTGSEGCSQTRTARTPRVSPRSSARVRSGRCAARRTPATGRGSAFRGRSAGPRLRRAGASRSAAPPGPGHTRRRRSAASARRPADPGRAHHSAGRIALPRSSPNRSQTSANRHELRRRPPCSAGPLPLSGLLGLPPRETSAAVAVTARDQRWAQYSCLTSPGVAAMGGCGAWQHRPLIRGSRHIVACN